MCVGSAGALDSLPEPILVRVLAELDTPSLVRCAGVCRRLRRLVWATGSLWNTLSLSRNARGGTSALPSAAETASNLPVAPLRSMTPASCAAEAEVDADRLLELVLERVHQAAVRSANLCGCARLTDRGVALLATHCAHSLRALDVSRCPQVTSEALSRLIGSCARLENLVATGRNALLYVD